MRDIARLCVILYLSQTLALPAQAAVDSGAYKQNHPVALVCKRHIAIYSGVSEAGTGQSYTQTGSDVLAPAGDITIAAKKVDILEARETSNNQTETKFKQSGLTLAVTSPVISAIQTAQQMSQAASNTRMCYVYSSTDECRLSGDDFAGRYTRFGSIPISKVGKLIRCLESKPTPNNPPAWGPAHQSCQQTSLLIATCP